MLFCLISTSIIHFVSLTIFPFASSPCTFPLTPWHLLFLSIFAFFICRLSFLDGRPSLFLLNDPFPSDSSFSRHECLTMAFFLFFIYSSLSLLLARVVSCLFVLVTTQNAFHFRLYYLVTTAPVRLKALLVSPYQFECSSAICCTSCPV